MWIFSTQHSQVSDLHLQADELVLCIRTTKMFVLKVLRSSFVLLE